MLKQNLKYSSKSGYGKIKIVSRFLKPIPSILGKYVKIVENKNKKSWKYCHFHLQNYRKKTREKSKPIIKRKSSQRFWYLAIK